MRLMESRILAAAVLLTVLFCLTGCQKRAPAVTAPAAPKVTVGKPIVREVTDYFEFPGQTDAVGEVDVRARVTGYLTKVNFEDGQDVEKDQLLFEIDPRPYQAALDRATSELARLNALVDKAKADLSRSERLRPSGAISQDEYEQHVATLAVHKASIHAAQAAVYAAELDLGFTKVLSPIKGRVSRRMITEGNLVQPGNSESTVLTTVVTTDPIYVYFNIDERALLKYEALAWGSGRAMRPDRIKELKIPVEIGLGNEEGFRHTGVLDFLDNQLDQKTGTLRARGVFDNAKRYLTPGMFVRVRLPFGQPHQALLVTERAIKTDQDRKYVLTVNKENVVESKLVKLGPLVDGLRVIEQGIQPGDSIIINGVQRARPGKPVQPHTAEKEVAASPPAPPAGSSPAAAPSGTSSAAPPVVAGISGKGQAEKPGRSAKN